MDDPELQAIRARRLASLQANNPSAGGNSPAGLPSNANSGNGDEEGRAQQREELRERLLLQILDNEARQRLQRVALVKPDRARMVEDHLISLAQSGRLRGLVTENALIQFLSQVSNPPPTSGGSEAPTSTGSKIIYSRRRFDDSDEEEDYGL